MIGYKFNKYFTDVQCDCKHENEKLQVLRGSDAMDKYLNPPIKILNFPHLT